MKRERSSAKSSVSSHSDSLKHQLLEKLEKLRSSSIKGTGVDSRELREAERLQRLVDLDKRHQHSNVSRLPVVAAIAFTFAFSGILVFIPLPRTQVSFEGQTTAIKFDCKGPRQLTTLISVQSLYCDFSDGEMPPTKSMPSRRVKSTLELGHNESEAKLLFISPVQIITTHRVQIRHRSAQIGEIEFVPAVPEVRLTLVGKLRVKVANENEQVQDFGRPRSASLREVRRLSFAMHSDQKIVSFIVPQIAAKDIDFTDKITEIIGDRSKFKEVSRLKEGLLTVESLHSKSIKLRPGSWMVLTGIEGEIQDLEWRENGLNVHLEGSTKEIRVGNSLVQRDATPSCLEWLQDRLGLKLVWGSALWLFSLGIAVTRWWKGGMP